MADAAGRTGYRFAINLTARCVITMALGLLTLRRSIEVLLATMKANCAMRGDSGDRHGLRRAGQHLDQDSSWPLSRRRVKKMTGTELRYKLGAHYAAQEKATAVQPGLLSTCTRLGIPVFVGAPSDGSVFLNSMKLWAMKEAGLIPEYSFDLDLHAEVFEACAYHYWGLFESDARAIATLILGGGVPKNFNLQPEPALGQVLGLPATRSL